MRGQCLRWVRNGKAQCEHMASAVLPIADIPCLFQSRSSGQNPVFRGWVFRNLSMN